MRRTNPFTQETQNIENVDRVDAPQFRSALISEKEMNVPRTIPARNNVYVAQVVERAEGELRPLEEAREDVARNVIAARKQEDSYREETRALANQLKKEYSSLDEIVVKRPDLGAEVKATSTPFSRKDPLYNQQLFLDSMQLYQEFKDVEPGTIVGPVNGLLGDMWLAQLVEKQVPQAADLAQFADERKQIIDRLKQTEEGNYVNDYVQHLRRQRLASMPLTVQQDIIDEIIGKDRQNTTEEPQAKTGDTAQESPAASGAEASGNAETPTPAAAEGSK